MHNNKFKRQKTFDESDWLFALKNYKVKWSVNKSIFVFNVQPQPQNNEYNNFIESFNTEILVASTNIEKVLKKGSIKNAYDKLLELTQLCHILGKYLPLIINKELNAVNTTENINHKQITIMFYVKLAKMAIEKINKSRQSIKSHCLRYNSNNITTESTTLSHSTNSYYSLSSLIDSFQSFSTLSTNNNAVADDADDEQSVGQYEKQQKMELYIPDKMKNMILTTLSLCHRKLKKILYYVHLNHPSFDATLSEK